MNKLKDSVLSKRKQVNIYGNKEEMIPKVKHETAAESFSEFLTNLPLMADEYHLQGDNIKTHPYKMKNTDADTSSIRDVWEYSNKPYVKEWNPEDLYRFWEEKTGNPKTTVWFDTDLNRENPVDTVNIRKGNLMDLIAELSHSVQYNKPLSVRDSLDTEVIHQNARMQDWQKYGEDWTVEGDAHRKIEPELWDMLKEKTLMTKIKEWLGI